MSPAETFGEGGEDAASASRPIEHCLRTGGFLWLTGIEDTFITAPDAVTGRTLDEYELTGHYDAWRADLTLAAELGIVAMRYGIPWHRVNPSRNVWDFSWPDAALERLLSLGIHPVLDLVHYGVPRWMESAFLDADYPRYVEEYAFRTAERYRGRVRYYTPFNEPRIAAWYSGKLGVWPPYRRGSRGFVEVLSAICRGIVRTVRALRSADPENLCIHADASDLYETADATLAAEAVHRQELVFLALDLTTGRVTPEHRLRAWLNQHGLGDDALAWFLDNPAPPDVVGINLYPMFSLKFLSRRAGRLRMTMPYAPAAIVERLARLYHERYALPIFVTETASRGSIGRRRAWLAQSIGAVARSREQGIPLFAYTWWPMFALVRWAYLRGRRPARDYLEQMGLWDLVANPDGSLRRVETPLVRDFRELRASALGPVGPFVAEGAFGGCRPRIS